MSFIEAGFILREDIIKLQWKMKNTREKWFGKKYDFYLKSSTSAVSTHMPP